MLPTRGDVEVPALRVSRSDLPARMFSELLVPIDGLRAIDLREAEIDGVRTEVEVDFRETLPPALPTFEVLPELAAGCPAPVGVEGLRVPIELPMSDLDVPVLEFDRLLELVASCLAAVEPDGLSVRIEVPIRDVLVELTWLRVLELDRLADEDTDGILVVMVRPMLDRVLVEGARVDEDTDGLLVDIELPMRALLLGLIRTVELLLIEVPDEDGLLDEMGRLEIVTLLEVEPPELLLTEIEADRLGVDLLTDILLEVLLRFGMDRLAEIELERLGVDLLIDILLELPRLEIDLLADIELDRLGEDLLTDTLLELLGLGVDLLTDILDGLLLRLGVGRLLLAEIELDRLGIDLLADILLELLRLGVDRLRLAEIEVDRLGVGARLTDGVLRLGVGARLGVAACADRLEVELFRELLDAMAESTTHTATKTVRISRKSHILRINRFVESLERFRRIWNLEMSLPVSMIASFLR